MFDDRLFDVIMEEMMSTFGADVRTDEGSLAYNACVKIAEKLEDVYGDMDALSLNILPDTMDLDHLIGFAAERGLSYNDATYPIVKGVFQQEIEIGEQFTCNDYIYTVIEKIDDYSYKLQCETEGAEANANLGELDMIDFIDDYQGGEITEVLILGADAEDEEVFRARVFESFKAGAFGGNKTDYRVFIDAIPEIAGCKPMRREAGSEWINIWILASDFNKPTTELVNQVQSLVDPEENHGEGDGVAPICHSVKIYPVGETVLNIDTTISFESGYSAETSQSYIEDAINDYLLSLKRDWESNENNSIIVRISQIDSKILGVEGVIDVSDTTINESDENCEVVYTNIPKLGEVIINV